MRAIILRLSWLFICFINASVAIPIGYAIVWIITGLVSLVLFFLWVIGVLIGLLIGSVLGGLTIGWMLGQLQQLIPYEHPFPPHWLRTNIVVWVIAACLCLKAFLPISSGDIAPLVPILLIAALIGSGIQWIFLRLYKVPGSMWWGSFGMLGTVSGTLMGLLLLGAAYGRTPADVLAGLSRTYESIAAVNATRLVAFNGKVLLFVEIEDTDDTNRWELWTSDGTSQGTTRIETGYTGWNDAGVYELVTKNHELFFTAHGTEDSSYSQSYLNGLKSWVTDGTVVGSHSISGKLPQGSKPPASLVSVKLPQLTIGVTTYSVVQINNRKIELRSRDGTSGQEVVIKNFP